MRAEVVIVQRVLPHYRVPFFEQLRARLGERGVDLRVLVGAGEEDDASRNERGVLDWAEPYAARYIPGPGRRVVWQPVLHKLRSADLVIVEQASKLLLNYVLVGWRLLRGPRLALWGHGANLDADAASPAGEAIKRWMADRSDWWFAYTQGTAKLVESLGVGREFISVVQNTTDTASLRRARRAMDVHAIAVVRRELGIGVGPVALSLGSVYPNKRPAFLLEAADHLRRMIPGFELIVIGDGPDRLLLDDAARSRPWLHVLGAVHGDDVARLASPATLLLNPGLVGLSVVDGFALHLPMVTCDLPFHSPEIEYLEDEVNGLLLPRATTPERYALEVTRLIGDERRLRRLSHNAAAAANRYSLADMVHRFTDGILAALSAPRAEERLVGRAQRLGRRWTS